MKKPLVGILAVASVALVAVFVFFSSTNNLHSATIAIKDMTCPACAGKISVALQNLDGVTAAAVSFEKSAAQVTFDPTRLTVGALENEISKLGYGTTNFAAQPLAPGQKKCEAEKAASMDCCAPPTKRSDT